MTQCGDFKVGRKKGEGDWVCLNLWPQKKIFQNKHNLEKLVVLVTGSA